MRLKSKFQIKKKKYPPIVKRNRPLSTPLPSVKRVILAQTRRSFHNTRNDFDNVSRWMGIGFIRSGKKERRRYFERGGRRRSRRRRRKRRGNPWRKANKGRRFVISSPVLHHRPSFGKGSGEYRFSRRLDRPLPT